MAEPRRSTGGAEDDALGCDRDEDDLPKEFGSF
jgi:hypothetical protein